MATTNFNIRLDTELRDQAFPVLEGYGLSAALAFKLFLKQVAETKTVPLSFDYAKNSMRSLEEGYMAMASDEERESEALEWCNALSEDIAHAEG